MEILLVTWSIPVVKFQCVACARAHAHWLSCSGVFATPWTVARQAPLSMEFSRQGYWRGLLFPSPEDLPHPRIEPASPVAPGGFSTTEPPEWVSEWSHSVVSDSLRPHGLWPTRLLRPWDFPGKNTGVGCYFLLQRIFPTQGLNLHLLFLLYH